MDAPTLVRHCASNILWVFISPRESAVFLFHFFIALVRFPLLWANMAFRTLIFGYIVFWPQIAVGRQWTQLCKSGQGIDGQVFSTGHDSALLDILLPPELWDSIKNGKPVTKKYPVMILYSGGAWIIGRRQWMRPVLLHFADAGFITVAADYRQFPFGSMKNMIQDALDSISYVFDQLEKPGTHFEFADPDQVVVLGQSAGAHICSLALLELARVRKEQMMLVAQGVTGCDKPYLRSKMKGVPLAYVGVGGFFDLVSAARDLHKKGLHSKVLEMMCEREPLHNYCARSRSKTVAEEARKRFVESKKNFVPASARESSPKKIESPIITAATSDVGTSSKKKKKQNNTSKKSTTSSGEICDKNNNALSLNASGNLLEARLNMSQSLDAELALEKVENTSSVNFLPRFSLFVHGDRDNSAPLDQALSMCATYNDAAARHPHELVGEDYRFEKRQPNFGTREPFYILTPKPKHKGTLDSAVKEIVSQKLRKAQQQQQQQKQNLSTSDELSSSDTSSPAVSSPTTDPFQGLCDCYAGSRSLFMSYINGTHTTLIVDDFFTEKANPPLVVCVKAMLAALNEIEEKHAVVVPCPPIPQPANLSSRSSSIASIPTPTNNKNSNNNSNGNKKNTSQQHQFTHTNTSNNMSSTLPFLNMTNNTTNGNGSLNTTNNNGTSPSKHARTFSEAADNSAATVSPMVAYCTHCRDCDDEISRLNESNFMASQVITTNGVFGQSSSTDNTPRRSHHHQREVSGTFLPDEQDQEEHPYDYLSAPMSVAVPADLFTRLFEKYYRQLDRQEFRNPERPIVSPFRRWLAQKISAF